MTVDHRALVGPAALALVALIVAEGQLARWFGHEPRSDDVLGSLWCALVEQAVGAFAYVGLLALYVAVYERFGLLALSPRSAATWALAVVGVDLAFYAFHRWSHATGLGWAVHAVHHQPPDLHFAAAVRNSAFGGLTQFPFLLPLAVLGVPPLCFVVAKTANPLYQIWVHTRLVGRLPLLDAVLNTPSNHRVHHGLEPLYRDRNFGGIFIVWDRLFGTYHAERSEPSYGTDPPFRSADPLAANLVPWLGLWRAVGERGWLRALLGPPAGGRAVEHTTVATGLPWLWVLTQTGLGLVLLVDLLGRPAGPVAGIEALVLVTGGSSVAGWLAGRWWALPLDVARGVGLGAALLAVSA